MFQGFVGIFLETRQQIDREKLAGANARERFFVRLEYLQSFLIIGRIIGSDLELNTLGFDQHLGNSQKLCVQSQKVLDACRRLLGGSGFTLLATRTARAMLFGFTAGPESSYIQDIKPSSDLTKGLHDNDRQRQFLRLATGRSTFSACQAGPGTGKTELFAVLALVYATSGLRTLVVAPSWKAVGLILQRLRSKLGSAASFCTFNQDGSITGSADARIVVITSGVALNPNKASGVFQAIMMDEAAAETVGQV